MKSHYKYMFIVLFLGIACLFSVENINAEEPKNGWVEKNGYWYYYVNGSRVKNKCREIYYEAAGKNCYFCFDSSGKMYADTEETIGGKTYTFDSNGVRSESYVNNDGVLVDPSKSGWILVDEVWFYYENGKPVTGLRTLSYSGGSGKFYFDEYGEMQVGFVYIEVNGRELEVYFDEEVGYMVTNTIREIDGVTYRFFNDGTYEETDGEYVSDDEDSDDLDGDDNDYYDDTDDTDGSTGDGISNNVDNNASGDGTGDIIASGGNSSGSSGGSGSGGGGSTGSTYVYSSTVKKTSCESLNNVIDFLMAILDIIHIVVPIILILMGSIDFVKNVTSFDEKKMQMNYSAFIKRCLCAVIVFFIPMIVNLLFSMPGVPKISVGGVGCEITTIIIS